MHMGSSPKFHETRDTLLGRALDRHIVTRLINRAGAAAGLTHIHQPTPPYVTTMLTGVSLRDARVREDDHALRPGPEEP
jgi:hypothetical protein